MNLAVAVVAVDSFFHLIPNATGHVPPAAITSEPSVAIVGVVISISEFENSFPWSSVNLNPVNLAGTVPAFWIFAVTVQPSPG